MADSDDEYDRKRRDKFRGERGSGGGGGGGGGDGGGGGGYRGGDRRGDDRGRGRDDWADRGRGRPDYRDYRGPGGGGGGRDRFSPDRGGPAKRMRTEWGEDGRPRYGGHDPYGPYGGGWGGGGGGGHHEFAMHGGGGHGGGYGGGGHREALHSRGPAGGGDASSNGDLQTQPPMLTLKQFLANQDDSISDSDAITKYNEYKQDFRRQQLNEFFVTHKDEEWFKIKYHPQESLKRKEEQLNFLKHRASVFTEQLEIGTVAAASVDTTQTEKLLRLLDTVVIKLEGGTDADLKVLDEKPVEPRGPMEAVYQAKTGGSASFAAVVAKGATKSEPNSDGGAAAESKPKNAALDTDENWDNDGAEASAADGGKKNPFAGRSKVEDDGGEKEAAAPSTKTDETAAVSDAPQSPAASEGTPGKVTKRKRSASDSSSSSSSSSSSDEDGDDEKNDASAVEKVADAVATPETTVADADAVKVDEPKVGSPKSAEDATEDGDAEMKDASKSADDAASDAAAVTDAADSNGTEVKEDAADDTSTKPAADDENAAATTVTAIETIDLDKEKDDDKPTPLKALHRTSSIFLRNLAPTITKAEVEAMCRRYAGFLRVAIADPLVERRWFRRGWVTFQRDVNIKEICWNLNNIRLRDCELGAIVNRDLSRRVRPINGITAHKQIVRSDVKLCAKIAFNLDARAGLWTAEDGADAANSGGDSNGDSEAMSFGLKSSNPVLQNITDYLIEEASAEEDELLGLSTGGGSDATADGAGTVDGEPLDRDPQLIAVLDRLILYLRVVHSVDFYNHCEYPYEDEMPNRCGIIHARGPAPQNRVTQQELQEYTRSFEGKMSSFLAKAQPLDAGELRALGCKDTDGEVEKFVAANTQELAKDKWLCPLSGKKFKGPDFIRKHIFNKHAEKVDEVRKEVEYFNNYLKDPKRPQLPEHPGNQRRAPAAEGGGMGGGGGGPPHGYRPGFHPPGGYGGYGGYGGPMVAPSRPRGGGFGGRRGGVSDMRPIIHYRDLDAPREPEDFL